MSSSGDRHQRRGGHRRFRYPPLRPRQVRAKDRLMAQLTDDCFAAGGPLMTIDEALALIMPKLASVVESESVSLGAALGRILASPIVSSISVPEGDNSAVDGYAVY